MKEPPTPTEIILANLHATCEAQRELLAKLLEYQSKCEQRLVTIGNWLMLLAVLAVLTFIYLMAPFMTD